MTRRGKSKNSLVIIQLFKELCKDRKYWNVWRTSEHWISLINAVYPDSCVFNFQKRDLNAAVSKDPQLKHCEVIFGSMSNSYGIYMNSHRCGNIRTVAYYATTPGLEVKKPPRDIVWWQNIIACSPSARKGGTNGKVVPAEIIDLVLDENTIISKKRQKEKKQIMEG